MTGDDWYTERLHADARQQLRIANRLYRGRTAYQDVEIFENPTHGRVLCLDGVVQTTEADEAHYHEMLVHPAMFAHRGAERVLVIGGADGGALRQVLRHPVKRAVLVDIDAELIELCRAHLPSISAGAFDDARAHSMPGDGAAFVAATDERFDVVIVDSTDPFGPGAVLFQEPFFRNCRRVLGDGGIVISQNGVPFYQASELSVVHAERKRVFARAGYYVAPVPLYAGGHMAFGWGSDDLDPALVPADALSRRIAAVDGGFRVYGAACHAAVFALPRWIEDLAAAGGAARA